jgi:glycosyltransferase involved in cell wall biosynthesis
MKVAVVTPTIGSKYLAKCLDSVQMQIYRDVEHYVFIDGKEHQDTVRSAIASTKQFNPINVVSLDQNVGKGWYGHRVYAACSFLVNADIICYLDEDNWFHPEHINNLVDVINKKELDWAYSLRTIVGPNGDKICKDDCESLGQWPAYVGENTLHIDTSCFAIKKEVALTVGHAWYAQWGADRRFFAALRHYFPKFDSSRLYTLNYRLEGNEGSVTNDFFEKGNAVMTERYPDGFPWQESAPYQQEEF